MPNVHLAHHPDLGLHSPHDHAHLHKDCVCVFAKTLKDVALGRSPSSPSMRTRATNTKYFPTAAQEDISISPSFTTWPSAAAQIQWPTSHRQHSGCSQMPHVSNHDHPAAHHKSRRLVAHPQTWNLKNLPKVYRKQHRGKNRRFISQPAPTSTNTSASACFSFCIKFCVYDVTSCIVWYA